MRRTFLYVCLLVTVLVSAAVCLDELRFYLRSEPKSFNPALVADDASETILVQINSAVLSVAGKKKAESL
jgi:hypothetical protein